MNARDNTPLRTMIANRLSAGEDTAAGIAKAIGKGDTPSIVVKELNAMRTDGQVECEQRGKKKELVYWLAVPLDVAAGSVEPAPPLPPATISEVMLPPGVRHGTRAAQIYRVLPLYGAKPMTARQIATATGAALGLISPTLSGMVKAAQVSRVSSGVTEAYGYTRLPPAGSDSEGGETDVKAQSAEFPPQIQPQITPAQAASDEVERDDAMPPADASLLALANRELADRLARVAHVLRGSGLEGLKDLDDGADLQSAAAALTGAYQMALAELHACTGKIADLQHKVSMQDAELFKQAGVVVDLRNQVESLQREAMRGALRHEADCVEAAKAEIEALRAKIEAMERQEPVAWCTTDETGTFVEALGMNQSRRFDTPLYLAPGFAQPAQSVPEGWKLVPIEPQPTALLVAVADLVAQMEIVSCVGFVDTPNDKDSCAAFCVAEGSWLELMSCVESLASALAAAPKPEAADHFAAQTALMKEKYDALRTKVEAMERQEPYAFAVNFPETSRVELVHNLDEVYEDMTYEAYEVRKLYLAPGAHPAPMAVAYLDIGANGYMDIGTDLTDEELDAIPKGRHMLGIVGTYGVEGYVPAQPAPTIAEQDQINAEAAIRSIYGARPNDEALWQTIVNGMITPAHTAQAVADGQITPAHTMQLAPSIPEGVSFIDTSQLTGVVSTEIVHPYPPPSGWLRAINEALVATHLGVANVGDTYEQAKAKLDSLIGFHVDVATDPAVNGGWKLVPTAESRHPGIYKMLGALHVVENTPGASEWESYAAMLAAAPEAKP